MAEYVLKGHVSYSVRKKYKWVAEFGKNTCEKCAALDGQEFEEGDVPYWPHPNCRCKVEELSVVDEVDSELNEYKEEINQLKLRAKELLGDSNVLREDYKTLLEKSKISETNNAKKFDVKINHLSYVVYKFDEKIQNLSHINMDKYIINTLQEEAKEIEKKTANLKKELEYFKKNCIDNLVLSLEKFGPDAVALYKLSTSKFTQGLDYIEKNGRMCHRIPDIKNKKLEKAVRQKVLSQLKTKDSRGIILNKNSSLSQEIVNSRRFYSYIKDNLSKLETKRKLQDDNLTFWWNINVYGSVHRCGIYNVRLENGFVKANIVDTLDYNSGEIGVSIFRDLQENKQLENYFIVVELEKPLSYWLK